MFLQAAAQAQAAAVAVLGTIADGHTDHKKQVEAAAAAAAAANSALLSAVQAATQQVLPMPPPPSLATPIISSSTSKGQSKHFQVSFTATGCEVQVLVKSSAYCQACCLLVGV